jgi:hypothetical protein
LNDLNRFHAFCETSDSTGLFNMRLRLILISFPLLLCVSQVLKPVTYAQAAALEASDAATLLAKSQAIDVKCGVLAKDKSQELRNFVARAEISLAEKASVATARKAITGGRATGKSAACDAAAKKLVNDVFAAATAATAAPIEDATTLKPLEPKIAVTVPAVKPAEPAPALAVAEAESPVLKKPVIIIKPQKPKSKVATVAPVKPAKTINPVKPVKGLGSYALVAEKYYVAMRCRSLSSSRINSLYQVVLINHRQAMASNRKVDVRNMLRSAEARAGTKSCI